MKVRIIISLKKSVLDTQGKAIEVSLTKNLGFNKITNVRQGKVIEFDIAENSQENIKDIVDQACEKLLINKVIEDYTFEVIQN